MPIQISVAESVNDLQRCFPVMRELRTKLDPDGFMAQVERQSRGQGYRLVFLEDAGEVRAVAGFRVAEFLAWGRTLYVDDLVTRAADRSRGYGDRLFDWLVDWAQREACDQLHLDSGVQRFAAHRFYLRKRMDITSHHFALELPRTFRT